MNDIETGEIAEIRLWTDHLAFTATDYYVQGYPASAEPYAVAAHKGQLLLSELLQKEADQSGESIN